MFIKDGKTHILIDFDINKIEEDLPNGIYKLEVGRNVNFYEVDFGDLSPLEGQEYKRIFDKVVKREASILLSGKSGFGKTLLMKHIAKKLSEKYPVIIVGRENVDALKTIANRLNKAVFLFDEFEKNYIDIRNPEDYEESMQYSQQMLLTLLDGTDKKHIFILTANEEQKISEYFFNRPGRIRYVFRFEKVPADIIESKPFDRAEKEILHTLNHTGLINFDILNFLLEEKEAGYGVEESLQDLGYDLSALKKIAGYEADKLVYQDIDEKEEYNITNLELDASGSIFIEFIDRRGRPDTLSTSDYKIERVDGMPIIRLGRYHTITFKKRS